MKEMKKINLIFDIPKSFGSYREWTWLSNKCLDVYEVEEVWWEKDAQWQIEIAKDGTAITYALIPSDWQDP